LHNSFIDITSNIPALAGYPTLTGENTSGMAIQGALADNHKVPLGFLPDSTTPTRMNEHSLFSVAPGLPFGLVLLGTKWSERMLLGCAYSYEQATKVRWKRRAFGEAIPRTQIQTTHPDQ
jgi:amidase